MAGHDQKTEQPTQRKLQKAREQGQFLSPREFVGGIQFLAFAALVASLGPDWLRDTRIAFRDSIGAAFQHEVSPADVVILVRRIIWKAFVPPVFLGAIMALIALATQLATSRLGFSWKKLSPSLARMNPASRLREIGGQAAGMAAHAIVLFAVISLLAYWIIAGTLPSMLELPLATVAGGAARIGTTVTSLLWKCAGILVIFGAFDFFRQKRKLDKQLKMTKQEIRDELKETEGNTQVKARLRRLRGELLRRRMMSQVPHATAVIVNPTHFAVAIRYEPDTMASPVVVAKGKNYLALRIREKATQHHVPIVENPPLARALYKSAEVGQQIPIEFYRAVAEILAYLYRMMNRR
jgi:flagellar biosynthetic protein FlhB